MLNGRECSVSSLTHASSPDASVPASPNAQRVAHPARGLHPDDDRGQDVAPRAVHPFAHREGGRADDRDRVHDRAWMVALDVAVVAERAVDERRGGAVGAEVRPEDLGVGHPAGLQHEPAQDGPDVVAGRRRRQQGAEAVVQDLFGARHGLRRDAVERVGLDERREAVRHACVRQGHLRAPFRFDPAPRP